MAFSGWDGVRGVLGEEVSCETREGDVVMGHGTIECGESGRAHSSVVEVSDLGFGTDGLGDDGGGGRWRRGSRTGEVNEPYVGGG